MSEPSRQEPLGRARMIACVAWVAAVSAVYCAAYAASLVLFARAAAPRFPLVARVLECLHLR
jgi:hypothetical protein